MEVHGSFRNSIPHCPLADFTALRDTEGPSGENVEGIAAYVNVPSQPLCGRDEREKAS
jgi:hypothetical protein